MWASLPSVNTGAILSEMAQKLLVKHVAGPEEIAEAYLFLMKYVLGRCA